MAKKKNVKPAPDLPVPAILPRFSYWALLPLFAVWALVALVNYQQKTNFFSLFPLSPLLWLSHLSEAGRVFAYVPQLAYAVLFAAFSFAVGGILLKVLAGAENKDIGELDWLFFSLGLGYGALSLTMLGLGFLGLYNKYAVFALLGAGLLAGAARFRRDFYGRLKGLSLELAQLRFTWFDRLLLFVIFMFAALAFVWALSPEIFFDSLVYHLGAPNYYIREGRVAAMAYNICSGFPLVVQMLYTAGLLVSDDVLARLIHFSTGLFLLGTLFAAGRRYASVTAGLLACVIFLGIPMVIMNLATTGMDVGSCWFTLLAAYSLLLFSAREGGEGSGTWDRTLLLAGVFTGLACGTKYQALFTVIAGFGVLAYRHFSAPVRGDLRTALKQALFYGAVTGLVFAPWPLKNILFHGNPLYPFFVKLFGGQQVDPVKWAVLLGDGLSRNLPETFSNWENLRQFLFNPWYLSTIGMGNADFVGPAVLLLLPLLFVFRLKSAALRHMTVFVAVMWLLWSVSTSMPRFFLQGLTVLSALYAALITGLGNKPLRWLCQFLLVLISVFSLQWLNRIEASQDGWRVVFGLQDRESYLGQPHSTYPSPYYPAMKYMNSALPPDSRVLFAGETRGYYCERRFIAPSVTDVHPLVLFARASSTPEEMQAKVAAEGFTHIFLNLAEAIRLDKGYHLFQWDEASIRVFNAWWDRYVQPVWSDVRTTQGEYRLLFVYRISPAPLAAPAAPTRNYLNDLYLNGLKK